MATVFWMVRYVDEAEARLRALGPLTPESLPEDGPEPQWLVAALVRIVDGTPSLAEIRVFPGRLTGDVQPGPPRRATIPFARPTCQTCGEPLVDQELIDQADGTCPQCGLPFTDRDLIRPSILHHIRQ